MVLEENGEDKMAREVTNEQFLECIGEKRTLLNNILRRKSQLDWSYSDGSERSRKKKNSSLVI